MCEFNSGRLCISHDREDRAALNLIDSLRSEQIEEVRYERSMDDLLGDSVPAGFRYAQHLVTVPEGEELWMTNYINSEYQRNLINWARHDEFPPQYGAHHGRGDYPGSNMLICPDSALAITGAGAAPAVHFQFDPIHQTYMQMLGTIPLACGCSGGGVTVAVLDTGIDPALNIPVHPRSRSFHDDNDTTNVDDTMGHGSVSTSIIHDLAPDATILVCKVGDENPISEWHVLMALMEASSADVLNMSLAYALPFRNCYACGRNQSHSSRSALFERTINELMRLRPETIVVAAAGNREQSTLDFPARFSNMVAVGALDSHLSRPKYSNYGATDHRRAPHDLLFFAPGGGNGEYVASTTTANGGSKRHEGTSFAAPYVTALLALYMSHQGPKTVDAHGNPVFDRQSVLDYFRRLASQQLPGYALHDYGNGLIQL